MIKLTTALCCIMFLLANLGCKNGVESKDHKASGHKKVVKEKWHWGSEQKQNSDAGYAQVVKIGNTIYISGVPTSDLSPKGIAELYKVLGQCLSTFGASPKDVVKETLYTTDIETMKKYNDSRKAFYKGDFPAATWVQISRLYEADSKLEVDLVAQLSGEDE